MDATDLTDEKLHEHDHFSRDDESVTTRFAKPKYWTVENFRIPKYDEGTKQGLDRYPGYDCLMLGIWNDRDDNEEGELADARISQRVHLDAGRYYFGSTFQTRNNLNQAYIFAATDPVATSRMEQQSLAWCSIASGGSDSKYNGIYFTISEPQDVVLGFQANLAEGSATQEFRADKVLLYGYGVPSGIGAVSVGHHETAPTQFYSLSGTRLQLAPQRGVYIVRQGSQVRKVVAK
mgnify:FL=1